MPALLPSVVWWEELPNGLIDRVAREAEQDPVLKLAQRLRESRDAAPIVAHAVATAAMMQPPPRSVKELSSSVGIPLRTLQYHWRRSLPVGPRHLIRWVLLLRAADTGGRAVSSRLGVDHRRLKRAAVELLGTSADEPWPDRCVVAASFGAWCEGLLRSIQ